VPQPPNVLWHYTGPETFVKILATAEMWATHYESSRDATDVVYANEIVEQVAQEMFSTERDALAGEFLRVFQPLKITEVADTFRICFCQAEEDISMWERYAAGSRGCALGFDLRGLLPDPPRRTAAYGLWPMKYDRAEQEASVKRDFARTIALARQFSAGTHRFAVPNLLRRAALFCMYFKHPSYASEREWRLAVTRMREKGPPEIFSHTAEGKTVRYIPLGAAGGGLFPLKRILIGPCASTTVADVEDLLRSQGFGVAREMPLVVRSKVLLRT